MANAQSERKQQILTAMIEALKAKLDDVTSPDFHGSVTVSCHLQGGVPNHVKAQEERVHKLVGGRLQ